MDLDSDEFRAAVARAVESELRSKASEVARLIGMGLDPDLPTEEVYLARPNGDRGVSDPVDDLPGFWAAFGASALGAPCMICLEREDKEENVNTNTKFLVTGARLSYEPSPGEPEPNWLLEGFLLDISGPTRFDGRFPPLEHPARLSVQALDGVIHPCLLQLLP